jgi:hypothetical protein
MITDVNHTGTLVDIFIEQGKTCISRKILKEFSCQVVKNRV